MTGPGGARGKGLAVALLAAALLAAWGLAVEPLIQSYIDQDERIANAGNLLARYRSLTAATPALRDQLAELEARRQGRSDLLEAASDTLAAAGLQSRLQALFVRDNTLLQTESGTSFMQGFNSFYYSFSPTIADYERQNPMFKEAVKLAITPLITSLSILNYVEIDSEAEMLSYGISLILLNIGMYFVAPAIVVIKLKKKF